MRDKNDTGTIDLLPDATKQRGRPKQHADQAAKQKAYRERLKAFGRRVVSRTVADVRDTMVPLRSDIIDLSQVSQKHKSGW